MAIQAPAPGAVLAPLTRQPVVASLITYSAVTWNPHRIHYDTEYTRELGYPGLVVHGAMQADWVLQLLAERLGPASRVRWYKYKIPVLSHLGQAFEIGGTVADADAKTLRGADLSVDAWVKDAAGAVILEASVGVSL
jgi:3-methylfumaryl-CoA hydratase